MRSNWDKRSAHIFFLKQVQLFVYLVQFVVLFSILSMTFFNPFYSQSTTFPSPIKKSSTEQGFLLRIQLSICTLLNNLAFDDLIQKSKTELGNFTGVFRDMPPVCPQIIEATKHLPCSLTSSIFNCKLSSPNFSGHIFIWSGRGGHSAL